MTEKAWIVIPARGGSTGLPRKNLRLLAGKPVIQYAIEAAVNTLSEQFVFVITDDSELAELAEHLGVGVIREAARADGSSTLDELVLRHLPDLIAKGAQEQDLVITIQPTCPLITPNRIAEAIELLEAGAGSVLSVSDDRHLRWRQADGVAVPLYEKRVNRQLQPKEFRESGAVIASRLGLIQQNQTRINQPVKLVELSETESVDIDSYQDLLVAEHFLTRKKIVIYANAAKSLGMGHVYRALALAQELARHEITLVSDASEPLGAEFFGSQVFPAEQISDSIVDYVKTNRPDAVILDVLDTPAPMIVGLKALGVKVVSFEDHGTGAELVDLLVSDLYPNQERKLPQLTGVENAILAPSFETIKRVAQLPPKVESILVLFGGTDPSGLALKSLSSLERIGYAGKVVCVRGMGAEAIEEDFKLNLEIKNNVANMPQLMSQAQLALSSAGRTITELMSIGVPTICLAQNQKELRHTHAGADSGIINLGLGKEVSDAVLDGEIAALIDDQQRRAQMQQLGLSQTKMRSNKKVVQRIEQALGL